MWNIVFVCVCVCVGGGVVGINEIILRLYLCEISI